MRRRRYLQPLGNRWLHVQQVAEQASRIARAVPQADQDLLVAAGYLHDIGYAPQLSSTGFHPLDGARWIRNHSIPDRLARLVAHHSCAIYEAQVRGLDKTLLAEFEPEQSATYDALVFCDMTVGPTGELVSFDERIAEIISRYGPAHEVTRAIDMSLTSLAACHRRTLVRLEGSAD
jgi:putative nucleotidyltransferase with HDIG domain